MHLDRVCGPVRACRRCRDPAQADRAKRDGRRAVSEQRTAAPAAALAARVLPSPQARRRRAGAMHQGRVGGPVRACRRCRDPVQADRAKRDGRRAVGEQGTAASATALAARERPRATRTAGEPERCSWTAHAGRCKPCRRRRDPAQADRAKRDGRRAVSEQGTAALATAVAPRGQPLVTRTAGEPERCTRAA